MFSVDSIGGKFATGCIAFFFVVFSLDRRARTDRHATDVTQLEKEEEKNNINGSWNPLGGSRRACQMIRAISRSSKVEKKTKKQKKKKNISYINLIIISAVFRCNPFSGFQVRARQIPSLSLFFFLIFFLNK